MASDPWLFHSSITTAELAMFSPQEWAGVAAAKAQAGETEVASGSPKTDIAFSGSQDQLLPVMSRGHLKNRNYKQLEKSSSYSERESSNQDS